MIRIFKSSSTYVKSFYTLLFILFTHFVTYMFYKLIYIYTFFYILLYNVAHIFMYFCTFAYIFIPLLTNAFIQFYTLIYIFKFMITHSYTLVLHDFTHHFYVFLPVLQWFDSNAHFKVHVCKFYIILYTFSLNFEHTYLNIFLHTFKNVFTSFFLYTFVHTFYTHSYIFCTLVYMGFLIYLFS